jgi:hypothetical protein
MILFFTVINRPISNVEALPARLTHVMICVPYSRIFTPVPVAAPSKAWVCSRSLAGNAGSIPAGDMDVYLL